MNQNKVLLKRIGSLLKKIKLEEYGILFEKGILNILPEKIHQALTKYKLPLTSSSVAELCIGLIEKKLRTLDELETLFYKIYTCDVAFHPSRSIKWATVLLEQEITDLPETLDDLNNVIIDAYNSPKNGMTVNTYSVYHNKIVWTVVFPKEKLKRGGFRNKAPILFAYKPTLENPHFLYSPPTLKEQTVHFEVYSESLGYADFSLMEFEGTDAIGMLDLIDKQHQLPELPVYHPLVNGIDDQRVISNMSGVFDYSHAEERMDYANKIFTGNAHQYFKIVNDGTLLDEAPRANSSRSRSGNEEIEFLSSIEISTTGNSSVEETLKHLISTGAITTPVPEYLLKINTTPSNSMTIHHHTHLQPNNSLDLL